MAAVAFNYAAWAARFPILGAAFAQPQAQAIFDEAQYVAIGNDLVNDEGETVPSIIADPTRRLVYLNLLVAHLCVLEQRTAQGNGAGAAMVGNVASASEGSVSVSMASYPVGTGKWYEQTQYGAQLWQMLAGKRASIYFPGPRAFTGVPFGAGGRYGRY